MDAREFKQRFMPYHRLLYRVAYRLTENAQDAEDLLQDTYLKLWQKRNDLKEEAMTEAYLVTLMKNHFRDQRRLKRSETSGEVDEEAEGPSAKTLFAQHYRRARTTGAKPWQTMPREAKRCYSVGYSHSMIPALAGIAFSYCFISSRLTRCFSCMVSIYIVA